ncbi:hypothetical protein QWY31_09125 [Cytophagales bacterium LB-30]|uniref:Lipoprotein n=1 Tax=Shiella aurantiaca TaxID=3058365 RepID=A0ABT8F5T7_9BACT|nr:hypothetical protein [Shiella aurantiaca]MDN4165663.1 hypothetical protein [Shiella aurantiaca]
MRYLVLATLLSLGLGCTSQKKQSQSMATSSDYTQVADSLLGKENKIQYLMSADSSYAICYTQEGNTPQQPESRVKYVVLDTQTGSSLLDGLLSNGKISWLDAEHVQIVRIPGIIQEGQTIEDYTQVVNVKTKKSVTKSEFNNRQSE